MAQQHISARDAGRRAEQLGQRAASSAWVERLARLGYATKGLVYAVVGVLAVQVAAGAGGTTTDTRGALAAIMSQPFGTLLLGVMAVGLCGYALWRLVEAAVDPDAKGLEAKGLGTRIGYIISAGAYAGLALTAGRLLLGAGGGGDTTQDWTARLMEQPFGRWLVGIVGLAVIGVGLGQLWQSYTAKFREQLKLSEMSPAAQTWTTRLGRLGLAARGLVFALIGVFLIQATLQYDAGEARGLGGALAALAAQPAGPWLLGLVALGLVAYGAYMFALARFRHIGPS